MKWNRLFVVAGLALSMVFVITIVRFSGTLQPVIVKIEPPVPDSEIVNREKLTTAQAEWWQPLTMTVHADGGRSTTFASEAASDEFDRREAEAEEAIFMAEPDDAIYVFDDVMDSPNPRQNNGFRDKIGVLKTIYEDHVELMPAFHFIARDNVARKAALTGPYLDAYNACTPCFWNVSIESIVPNNNNGFDLTVLAIAGHRSLNGPGTWGEACELSEKWSVSLDGSSAQLLERKIVPEGGGDGL